MHEVNQKKSQPRYQPSPAKCVYIWKQLSATYTSTADLRSLTAHRRLSPFPGSELMISGLISMPPKDIYRRQGFYYGVQ
ncbi:hypothetical protein LC612_24255 [Nostoc sp. CHAB 5834]|nr:hypothetical protein [Nostoc sp. CHAB 5834]